MEKQELFKELDESFLLQIAELYKAAFGEEPWNDDWSDEEQLLCYIRDIACGFNSLNFEALENGYYSIRIDYHYRLQFKIRTEGQEPVITICTITDITNHYQ